MFRSQKSAHFVTRVSGSPLASWLWEVGSGLLALAGRVALVGWLWLLAPAGCLCLADSRSLALYARRWKTLRERRPVPDSAHVDRW